MKRRFEFRLERVRRVRAIEERLARAERAGAETRARTAEELSTRAREALQRSHATLGRALVGRIDARAVLAAQLVLDAERLALRARVESARTLRMQAARSAAVHDERRAAARALDELRERARLRHADALRVAELAVLDETASRRADARRRGERPTRQGEEDSRPGSSATDDSTSDPSETA